MDIEAAELTYEAMIEQATGAFVDFEIRSGTGMLATVSGLPHMVAVALAFLVNNGLAVVNDMEDDLSFADITLLID